MLLVIVEAWAHCMFCIICVPLLLQVTLTGNQVLEVQPGDHFGFTWLNYGVVKFTYTTPGHYCEEGIKPDEGSNVVLQLNRHGNRDYSIRLSYNVGCSEASNKCGLYLIFFANLTCL